VSSLETRRGSSPKAGRRASPAPSDRADGSKCAPSVRPSRWGAGLALLLWLVGAIVETSAATAQSCERPPLDCARDDAPFARRVRVLARRYPDIAEALEALRFHRLAWCHERNACALDDEALSRLRAWSEGDLDGFRAAAATALGRTAWARSVSTRAMAAVAAVGAQAAPIRAEPSGATRAAMARLEADLAGYAALQTPLTQLLAAVDVEAIPPPVCQSDVEQELRPIIRGGSSAASEARSLRDELREFCAPFERYLHPGETLQNRMRSFLTDVGRVEGWMRDILQCVDPGPYGARCQNTYGPRQGDTAQQARRALEQLAEVRRVVDGIPEVPFPCDHPVWDRLERSRWTLGTARAQMPSIARRARDLCRTMGVDGPSIERTRRELREELERSLARLRRDVRARRQGLSQFRASLGLDP